MKRYQGHETKRSCVVCVRDTLIPGTSDDSPWVPDILGRILFHIPV